MEKNPKPERPKDSDDNESLEGVTVESLGTAPMMMTADEIATCLNISTRTVWRLKAKGDLPKVGQDRPSGPLAEGRYPCMD